MVQKAQLIDLIHYGSEEISRFANLLSEQERNLSGAPDRWSARDVLAHIGEWQYRMAKEIEVFCKGGNPALTDDMDAANRDIFDEYSHRPWEDILDLVRRAQKELLNQIVTLTEEELNDPALPWLNGRPLWRRIAGKSFLHPVSHLGPAYIDRGNRAYANQLREREAKLVSALDDSPVWQGIALYNLACHYALMGEKQKALKKLEQGLRNNPDLVEYSTQDPDLVSLHGDPEFHVMLERLTTTA